ncbi:helix-hairpin-helix domain-containing protein [Kribbella sp. NPDC048928]|uniref:helix-hairpin-helix domain-containing protein n=1 Tax=Kribbella sp. NPDC048928 TaxID=3364111 RepID=UPI0037174AEB
MKVFRRNRTPTPDARARALSRLAVRPSRHAHPDLLHADDAQPEAPEERDEVRGGWIPDQVPDRLRNARWTLTPRHVLVLLALLAIGLTWAIWTFAHARPTPIPEAQPTTTTTGSPVAQPTSRPSSPQTPRPGAKAVPEVVVVYVAGKVRRPGLVRAPTGSRVADVLTLAGGALHGVDLTTLNLARLVTDGEQIIVGQPAQPAPTKPPGATTSAPHPTAPNAPVNLNTATLDQLDTLPGVGPVLAQRILDFRTQNGPFTTVDQLQEVPGVGPKKFDSLKPHVSI